MQRPARSFLRLLFLLAFTAAGVLPAVVAAKPVAREEDAPELPHWSVTNQANARYQEHDSAPETALSSNVLRTYVPLNAPLIRWYNDPNFTRKATAAEHGQQVYIEVSSEACDLDPNEVELLKVTITSSASHDEEIFWAREVGEHSNTYHVEEAIPLSKAAFQQATQHNGALELSLEDILLATVDGCGSGTASDLLLIDPIGVVFDSTTNHPVPGATVSLIDITGSGNGGRPGEAAVVYLFDAETPAPSTVVTGADGVYQFPLVAPSQYRLVVTPPGDYHFPSTVAMNQMSTWGRKLGNGSYGQQFEVSAATGTVQLDVPLDTPTDGLFLQKRAARESVEIGDTLQYSITMRNVSGLDLTQLTVTDRLPPGFSYLKNTAKLDGVTVTDPVGGKGPVLSFPIDALSAAERTLTYRVAVGPGALEGDGTNRAQLKSEVPARKISNLASVKVAVEGGVFDDRAYVLGKIFADCNANAIQDAGEPGVPHVRLYMEDGSFVISDDQGKYSFYGVSPRTHVLKVDATTLPEAATLEAISHRHAKDGGSQFVDVKRSELHRADFAIAQCSDALMQSLSLAGDSTSTESLGRELSLGLKNELKPLGEPAIGDARALAASGIVGETYARDSTKRAAPIVQPTRAITRAPTTLETLLHGVDNKTDFLGLVDGDEIGTTQIAVRVKGQLGSSFDLQINDEPVPADRVGTRTVDSTRRLEAWEFIGVELHPGANSLKLIQRDPFGNARDIREITLVAPDIMARINITVPKEGVPADGERTAQVRVQLEDKSDVIVAARTPVTLEATRGTWEVGDLDPNEPGTQVFVEGGQAEFRLRSPATPGVVKVAVTSGRVTSEAQFNFVPALRPMVAAGLVEGTLDLSKFDMKALSPARREDGFEEELRQFSARDGELTGGARAALFLKGKVRGDYLLTLGYDSEKDSRERLFRDIQPDRFYPVYGDSSVKGYDAQSTSRLYVRIDKDHSYLLAGDFTTQSLSLERKLSAYNRSLTGVNERYQRGPVAINAYASRDNARQVIEEFSANGTSGPFFLGNSNALENSEQIEILTRDRDQPSVVLSSVPQQRFADYEIEPLTGRILFRAPIPSVDENLNPISIRIAYEAEQGGQEFWTTGVDTQVQINEFLEIGAALVDDQGPEDARRILSTNATLTLGEHTKLVGEFAHTRPGDEESGNGERVELTHDGAALQVRVFAGHTDATFDNPSSYMSANRDEAGAKASYSITERLRVLGEALHSADVTNSATRTGALLGVEQSFAHNIKAELGTRQVSAKSATGETSHTSTARTKVTTPVPFADRAAVYGEYEQDINIADNKVAAVGGEYRLAGRSRLYARHELISSLTGPYELDPSKERNTTVFGVDTSYLADNHVFSEYRIADAISGREAQAAIGLRNGWQLARGVRLNTTAERVDALAGTSQNETSAVTGAIEYTRNPLWKGTARLELRDAGNGDGVLSTFGVASKLSEEWTFLGRNAYALTRSEGRDDRVQERLQFGFAYRDGGTNRMNGLWRYELKTEQGVEVDLKRTVHIVSTHMDYQYAERTVIRGQYSAKLAKEATVDGRFATKAQLVGGRVTRDFGSRVDLGVHIRALVSESFSSRQGGAGAEVGFLMVDNLWLSAGYNVMGFRDEDLASDEYTRRGAYLRMRFKFDESILAGRLQ